MCIKLGSMECVKVISPFESSSRMEMMTMVHLTRLSRGIDHGFLTPLLGRHLGD